MHILFVKLVSTTAITKIIKDIAIREHQMTVNFFISQQSLEEAEREGEGEGGRRGGTERELMITTHFIHHL